MPTVSMEKEINALIRKGIYKSKVSLYNDAMRVFFTYRPELKVESAIELYTSGEYALAKAAEIAGIDIESFKEELTRRGVKIEIPFPDKKNLRKGVSAILGK